MGEILSQITRIDNNIQNALAKVAAKGVTVSDDAGSDELPGLIEQISQAEDLNTVLTEQEALITELETVLAGKAAGGGSGGSVETCTVEITCDDYSWCVFCFCTCYENGQIVQKYIGERIEGSGEIFKNKTLENVVCGTYVHAMYSSGMKAYRCSGFEDGNPLYMYYYDFCARTTVGPGETATIEFYDEDA